MSSTSAAVPEQSSPGRAAVLLACGSLTVMAGATIAPALPLIAAHFQALRPLDPQVTFWAKLALTGPGLFTALFSLIVGPICDRLGRMPVLMTGLVLYIFAGTTGLYLNDLWLMLTGRALLGAAVAMIMVASSAIIADVYAGPARQRFNGLQSMAMSWGGVIFLTLAGVLADMSWRFPFAIYLLPLPLLLLAPLLIRTPSRSTQATTTSPHEPLPARTLAFLLALGFTGMVLFYIIPTTLPFYMQELGITQKKWAGIAIATSGLVAGLMAMQYGRVRARLSFPAITAIQFGLMGLSYILLSHVTTLAGVLISVAINGLGQGFMLANLMSWTQATTPPSRRGQAIGLVTCAVFLGQFFSPILTKPLADRVGLSREWLIAGVILLTLSAAFALGAFRKPRVAPPTA